MTRLIFLLIATISLFNPAKADTIDYWHVYYNDSLIGEYTQSSKGEIVLKVNDIKWTDSLTIYYFNDTPCPDCLTQVIIKQGSDWVITTGNSVGTSNPIRVSLKVLVLKVNSEFCNVYYYEGRESEQKIERLLFRIRIE